ncbi:MAG TPA: hypothetical protein VM450_19665 [Thermomicrobiales bacterium]|nr:hypothetical protein [Thermomicrobiales bacterium]
MGPIGTHDTQPDPADEHVAELTEDEAPEGPGRIAFSELWPPTPRVRLLYIGLGFVLLNGLLLCVWAYALFIYR